MKKRGFVIALFAVVSVVQMAAQDGPTMGWSSWNTFSVNISENIIKGQGKNIPFRTSTL